MTAFAKGEEFVAAITAQGMVQGRRYIVRDLDELCTPFGTFVTYYIEDSRALGNPLAEPGMFAVGNLHLLGRKIGWNETRSAGGAS